MIYAKEIESIAEYDVVIVGAGASGICAALSAEALGVRVALVERFASIGGGLTVGHVGPTMGKYGSNTAADRINKLIGCDKRCVQDFELAKIRLTELVTESSVELYLNTALADATVVDGVIKNIIVVAQSGLCAISGRIFVDATGDGVLAYLCGEDYEIGREDGLTQPTSIMFTVAGVSPDQTLICRPEEMDTQLKRGSYLELCRKANANGELPDAVNIVRLYPTGCSGERMVNATQFNGVNGLDPIEYSRAQGELRKQMLTVTEFLKNNVEGFENIKIKDSSDGVGVRETRRIKGKYILTAEDLIESKRFADVVVHDASFPIDIHNPSGAGQAESDGCPVQITGYDIPYGALVPVKTKNLYLSGRCISGTHRAHASYRVMNIAMNIGEAVGVGAALCAKNGQFAAELDPKAVQNVLCERGIDLFANK